MRLRDWIAFARIPVAIGFGMAALTCFGAYAAVTVPMVSQKGRAFTPREVTINRGESIRILNDDADLRHHVYVDSDKFNFDSGDQAPGTYTSITFPIVGDFDVLCAIHPKMKLLVRVK